MTALDQYVRLEATGRWRESASDPWREVLVSFGNSSLVLSDFNERALSHWALAAIADISEGGATRFAPAADSSEQLELADRDMIAAISETTALARAAELVPERRSLLKPAVSLLLLGLIVGAVLYGPGFLKERAFAMVPPERAVLVGQDLAASLQPRACDYPAAQRSIGEIARRAGVAHQAAPLVLHETGPLLARLPGGQPLFDAALIEDASAPEAVAGWLLLAEQATAQDTVLHALIRKKPTLDVLGFLFSGEIAAEDKFWMAKALQRMEFAPDPLRVETVRAKLAERGIAEVPFLNDLARHIPDLAVLRPAKDTPTAEALLSDQAWVALQSICIGL